MTLIQAINKVDELKPNDYSQSEKIGWLSKLDGRVKTELIDTHETSEEITFNGYDDDTPLDTELLVPFPYDDVYISWLEAQIDYSNAETTKYNNSITTFNDDFNAFSKAYNRQYMPKGKSIKYF